MRNVNAARFVYYYYYFCASKTGLKGPHDHRLGMAW